MARKYQILPVSEELSREKIKYVLDGMYDCFNIRDLRLQEGAVAFELAKRLNVKVVRSKKFYENKEHCLTIRGRENVTATIPADQPLSLQNFTLAMDLGFYILHYLYPGLDMQDGWYKKSLAVKATGSVSASGFRQANIFAQHMTMPNALITLDKKRGNSARSVAKRFEVPVMMAAIRLRDFVPTAPRNPNRPRPRFY